LGVSGTESRFYVSLQEGGLEPSYLFYGPEDVRISGAVETIRAGIEKEAAEPSTAWSAYDLNETGFPPFISDLKTVSFFGGKRGIIGFNFHVSAEGTRGPTGSYRLTEEEQKALLNYLDKPAPDITLILRTAKIDSRVKFWKELKRKTASISFDSSPADRKGLIRRKLGSTGLSFTAEAETWLMERFIDSFNQLETEIDKLETFMGGEGKVTIRELEECMSIPQIETIWALTEAVAEMQIGKALSTLHSLKTQKQAPEQILPMIARQFRLLLICKSCRKKKLSIEETAQKCGLGRNTWVVKKYIGQASRFSTLSLKKLFCSLAAIDVRVKSSGLDRWVVFEEEIISLFTEMSKPPKKRTGATGI